MNDLQAIQNFQIDAAEIAILRQRLSAEKQALQGQLGEINARCAVRLTKSEYQRIQSQRGALVKLLAEKEAEISQLNAKRAEVAAHLTVRRHQFMSKHDIQELVSIRDRWHGFSMDAANHQKAREAAWKFSQELRAVLKHYFDGHPDNGHSS